MEFLQEFGYMGLFAGTFLAATVIPFSSEFLFIGMLVAGGDPLLCFVLATVGNWLGGLTSYGLGYMGKWEWLEKWFGISREKLERQKRRIDKYGAWLALLSWAPFVGDVFSIGLGFYRLDPVRCSLFMLLGKAARFGLWTVLYAAYGQRFIEAVF